ncbi:MAG: YifB family Mg chelatase-like AAA ATPase [Defluviitaleaceae bacterium]|nr:YifB family Mg chelatase-like AAA ATPase [Defluviitaleaceae bacterium]
MLSKVVSAAILGVDGYLVFVEVDVNNGLPSFDIVGLPDSAVKESKDRVRTAIRNSGFVFPVKRITVNLAPADTRKVGPAFDLPIAVGILVCIGVLNQQDIQNICFSGELSLDGAIRPVNGVLSMALAAKAQGIFTCCIPKDNATEASLVKDTALLPISYLRELVDHFNGQKPITQTKIEPISQEPNYTVDFFDVKGQQFVKRALEVAAAGSHNLLMIGPPGAGKTMLAHRMPTITPNLTTEESLEITKIYSIAGLLNQKQALITERPFRSPHHTASPAALSGGGRIPTPGEISLAHNGILFLDELPEFQKKSLEILRQPLEDGVVTISRASGTLTYPSKFMLLASMNPCPCGYFGATGNLRKCSCTSGEIEKYLRKISGPMLDRIDIQVEATNLEYTDFEQVSGETSRQIRQRVIAAQNIQNNRFLSDNANIANNVNNDKNAANATNAANPAIIRNNAHMTAPMIERYCELGSTEKNLIRQAFDRLGLSARAYHKILKIARTIADLESSEKITVNHISEALSYRSLDRKYW